MICCRVSIMRQERKSMKRKRIYLFLLIFCSCSDIPATVDDARALVARAVYVKDERGVCYAVFPGGMVTWVPCDQAGWVFENK